MRCVVLVALIATVVCLWFVGSPVFLGASHEIGGHKSRRAAGEDPASSEKERNRLRKSRANERRLALLKGTASLTFNAVEFQKYLEANNRSARSLVAVYLLTHDESALSELKNHTDNAEAMLCLASTLSLTAEERRRFIGIYCQLNPNEMQGYLMAATVEMFAGKGRPEDLEAFQTLIRKGMGSEDVSLGISHAREDQRQALESTGMDRLDVEANLAAQDGRSFAILHGCMSALALGSRISLQNAATTDEKIGVMKEYLSVAQSFKELLPYANWNGEQRYYNLMNDLLDQLPPDAQLGDEYGRSGDLRKKLENECRQLFKTHDDFFTVLVKSPPEVVNQYLETRINEGEAAAQAWLLHQDPVAK